jgi:subtilase family serine protease
MKKSRLLVLITFLILVMAIDGLAQAPSPSAKGTVTRPPSALGKGPAPARIRTPLYVRIPANNARFNTLTVNGETPASIACIYGVVAPTNGCPTNGTVVPTGGSKAIAVVEYGTYANVQNDLNTFSTQFGLPSTTITQICQPSPCPNNARTGWDLEEALDVEYAHAMAPNAQIIVASFTNDALTDGTETAAAAAVAAAGGGGGFQ